ncbi:glycerophosphodiester phosphodiesterase family protein [Nocardioides sp. R-C-SC26]|uniref:glycerophosphodiester phosphodiesterase family protein n=1 Tax=Nocardioides sp. R-C-SC26 TaxID=2870414 RepID=UPI001E52D3FC|nr:glycerophosphodiester phosphodiesterase family protein [Nocardioides sp. R-C-SC26]
MRKALLAAAICLVSIGMVAAGIVLGGRGDDPASGPVSGLETDVAIASPGATDRRDLTEEFQRNRPIVVGHRGAWATWPDYTEGGYRAAVEGGADFVDVATVMTKDGVLLARYDGDLAISTDIASRSAFKGRRTTRVVNGREVKGWFAEDFTWRELSKLRSRSSLGDYRRAAQQRDDREQILRLEDVLDLVRRLSRESGRDIGVVIEPRDTEYVRGLGQPIEPLLTALLKDSPLAEEPGRVLVQTDDTRTVTALADSLPASVATAFQVTEEVLEGGISGESLRALPSKIDLVVADIDLFVRYPVRDAVTAAHEEGLALFVRMIAPENALLLPQFRQGDDLRANGDQAAEVRFFLAAGVDGVFADAPAEVSAAVDRLLPVWRRARR